MTDFTVLRTKLDQTILNAYAITLDQLKKAPPLSSAAPPATAANRVYVGAHHKAPPGAHLYTSSSGRQFWVPSEARDDPTARGKADEQSSAKTPGQTKEQGALASRYKHTIDLLTSKREQLTEEIQQHLQHAAESPVDSDHLHKLNAKLSQIEQELGEANSRYDEASTA